MFSVHVLIFELDTYKISLPLIRLISLQHLQYLGSDISVEEEITTTISSSIVEL